ncbi:anti-sigma factor [Nocardioides aequoreus]|uniref:anti-sigma factor n=1 Tax=Nocardioides aequoreus TaxID=397278 RepID=UPI0004C3BB4D|nr:anti-sigma factor [Nocardioides aequoreus]
MSESHNDAIHALSGAYAVDALHDEERQAFEQHLQRCAECQEEVTSLREAAALLALPEEVPPPAGLRDAVLAAAAQVRPLPPEVDQPAPRAETRPTPESATVVPFRRRLQTLGSRSRLALVAAAAVVVTAAGVGITQPWEPDTATYTATERVLEAPDAASVSQSFPDGSSATVTRSPSQGKAVLETHDMDQPPSGHVFQLWLMDDEGTARPAGTMGSGGDHEMVLDGDAAEATAVGITVEPEGGSEQPTTEPIAMFDLGEAPA